MKLEKDKLVIHRPAPEFKINSRHSEFDERLASYRRDIPRYHRDIEMLCRLLEVKEGQKVLNVGAGIGFTLYELASLGVECYDLDICPGDPEFVAGMAKFYGFDIRPVQGDGCAMPFPDNFFDSVYSKDTFEHIWDFETAMLEQIRVLKPGGKLLVLVGNLINPKTFFSMFVKRFIDTRGKSGGLKWLLTKHRAMESFGIGWHGKDEDWKTLFWWRRKLREYPQLKPLVITTTRAYNDPAKLSNRILEPFVGGLIILAEKKMDGKPAGLPGGA